MNIILDTLASARSARWLGHAMGLLAYLGLAWLGAAGDLAWFAAVLMAAALLVVETAFSLLDLKARRLKALAPNAFPFKQMADEDRAFLQTALATLPSRSWQRSIAAWVLAAALLSAWHVSYIGMALLLASGAALAALCQFWMDSAMLKRVLPFFYLGESGNYARSFDAWLPGLPRRFLSVAQAPLWVALLPLLLLSALGQALTPGLLLYQGLLGLGCAFAGRGLLLNVVDAPIKDLSLALKRFGGGDLDALLDITNGGSVGEATESFNQALRAVDRRLFMLEKFGHSVPPGRSEGVLDELRLDGEHRQVAVLSAQWLGADSALRAMEPKARLNALGRFYEAVQDAVDRHQGCTFQLDDGAVLAVWGAPFKLERPVEGALGAAWDLQTLLPVIARQQAQRDQVTLDWGLGLALGQASTGLAGPRDRERYSLHGGPLPEAKALAQRGGGVWLDERSAAAAQAPFGVSIGQEGARLIQGPQGQAPSPELLGFKPGELL